MKRLISLIIVVFVVTLPAQAASDRGFDYSHSKKETGNEQGKVKISSDEDDGGLFGFNPYLKNYLPLDTRLINHDGVGRNCNTDGSINENGKFLCIEYVSPSTKERYRIRHSGPEGLKIFNYIKEKIAFYASFTPNPEPWKGDRINHYSKVLDQSEKARKYALAHSEKGDETPVAADKSTPVAPAIPSTPTTSILDCSHGNLFEKAQCIAKNAAANKL